MRFIFEYKPMDDAFGNKGLARTRLFTLRRMMLSFENMVNTTLPAMRVHLSEEESQSPKSELPLKSDLCPDCEGEGKIKDRTERLDSEDEFATCFRCNGKGRL